MDYINFALSSECQPILANPDDKLDLDLSVLDSRCLTHSKFLSTIDSFLTDDYPITPEESALLEPLSSIKAGTFVLSLSGGVDSMCLLVLLRKAKIPFVAVHIRHSSRLEDTRKELDWVRFVCKRLNVPLYYHHVLVSRPHGDEKGEITRDEFEEYTRRIRFCMYRKAALLADPLDAKNIFVLIGHHMDDVDENRIAELGKGNLIDIDGMTEEGETGDTLSSVTQLRPFCRDVRKSQLRDFAVKYGIPHMKNSTPKWSKRGWIRDVLDQDEIMRARFVKELEHLGDVSRRADGAVNSVCEKWMLECPIVTRNISADTKTKKFTLEKSVRVELDSLIELANESVVPLVIQMASSVNEFAPLWNNSFKKLAEERDMSCPIQEIRHVKQDGNEILVVSLVRALQVCFRQLRDVLGVDKFVPRKSVAQLVELVKSGRSCVTWKINRVDVHMIRVEGSWYVMDAAELKNVIETMFASSMEAFRKCVISNPDKIRIVSH